MYLKRRIEETLALSESLSESQLINALRALIAEYDCDHNFYTEPTLDIPPSAYIRAPELDLGLGPRPNLTYG